MWKFVTIDGSRPTRGSWYHWGTGAIAGLFLPLSPVAALAILGQANLYQLAGWLKHDDTYKRDMYEITAGFVPFAILTTAVTLAA